MRPYVLAAAKLNPMFEAALKPHFELLDQTHTKDPQAFAKLAPHIHAVAGGGETQVSAALMSQLPALQIVSIMGVGYDGVDVSTAKAKGAKVTHTPNVLNDDVADLAMGLMLGALRQLPAADRYVRDGSWQTKGAMPLARKLSGLRLGIVGMGRIGQAIAQRAVAFGMPISYFARNARTNLPYKFVDNIITLASSNDVLCVITPGGAATKHLINADVLKALGSTGYIVNVARGSVVDEDALIDALERKVIAGAGLDVFANEPNVPERLRRLDNVVLAPHIGSATTQTRQAMAQLATDNLRAHFDKKPLLTPVPECA